MKQKQKNSKIVVITNAGGVGVVCMDLIAESNLELFNIDENLNEKLREFLPPAASLHNPIDILGDSKSDRYDKTLQILASQNDLNGIVVIVTPQIMTDSLNIAKIILDTSNQYPKLPIIPVFIGQSLVEESLSFFSQNKFPCYNSPEAAIFSLEKYLKYNHQKNQSKTESAEHLKISNTEINQIQESILNCNQESLDYLNTQKIAKVFQIPTANFSLITDQNGLDLEKATEFLNQCKKAVIKVVSAGILHRSEQKMVELNITNIAQIESFYTKFKAQKPDIVLQEMIEDGIQCFIGVNRDPQFGPTLILGSGGVYAEIMDDFVLIPLPATKTEILNYLKQTKLYQILNGARNTYFDINSFIEAVFNLSQILNYFPKISSIDINPYIAQEKGGKVVDFKVVIG